MENGEMTERQMLPVTVDGPDPFDRVPEPLCTLVRSTSRLEKEEVFELLYNPRRRATLRLLARYDRPFSMDELVEQIAAEENGVPVGELERQQCRRVHVSLYQTHLPLLDETGAIEYDHQADRIAPGSTLPELTPYLDAADVTTTIPWRAYYRWLLAVYACLGAVVLTGAVGMPSLLVLSIGVSTLFLMLALVHGVSRGGDSPANSAL